MYSCMLKNLETIKKAYKTPGNHLICLEGKKGTGKSTVLREFSGSCECAIQIEANSSSENYLAPIVAGLYHYSGSIGQQFTETLYSDFTYEEVVLEQVLNICAQSPCAIVFHDFLDYSKEFIKFIQKLISTVIRKGNNCSVLIEIDSDNPSYLSKIQTIYAFPSQEHVYFADVEPDDLKAVFLAENPNLLIADKDLIYIISSANKNPAMLNIIVNYLKGRNYITAKNGDYVCKNLQTGILSNILKEDFCSRFDHLDELMKATFLKSSMFGMEFYVSQLAKSFEMISASETLEQIEEYSSLLVQKEETPPTYMFSSTETLHFAESIISDDQKIEWGNILYTYYQKRWEQLIVEINPAADTVAVRAAFYASTAHKYQEAATYYFSAIFSFMKKGNYQQVLMLLENLAKLPSNRDFPKIILMHLMEFKAACLENLGRYGDAYAAFRETIQKCKGFPYFDVENAQYHLAYCAYYTSQVDLSLELAESLKTALSPTSRTDSLYFQVVSLLATIYREKANPKFTEMYLLALNECKENGFEYEYYVQLRKANLCYTEELATPMLKEAAGYFKANNYQKEYGKVIHNLGTGYLYIGNDSEALQNLEESRNIFAKVGSVDEVYGINCMGVWYATVKQNYEQSLRLFQEAEQMPINDFKRMTICANIATCYQKLHLFRECEEYIRKCDVLPARRQNKDVGFYERTFLFAEAFFYLEQKKYELCLEKLRSCWTIPLKNDQSYLAALIGMEICTILNMPPIKEERTFSCISHSSLYERYHQNQCIFHTLRFIE